MAVALERAVRRNEWIVLTEWSPHWMFGAYDLRYLNDPKGVLGSFERVHAVARIGFYQDNVEAAAFFSRVQLPIDDLQKAMYDAQETSYEEAVAKSVDVDALERRVAELNRELEHEKQALAAAREEKADAEEKAAKTEAELASQGEPEPKKFQIGPLTIGGAVRVNFVLGSYPGTHSGPNRGGNGGNVELDTFRINLSLDYKNIIGKVEYRWYTDAPQQFPANYNFLHTGWLGYRFSDDSHVEVGVNRVPFGPGPNGVSQSWFFDQHYYVGLADDMDLGVKYVTNLDNWSLDFAWPVATKAWIPAISLSYKHETG
jgi:hypothetical protein